jgi:threonine dehydratase
VSSPRARRARTTNDGVADPLLLAVQAAQLRIGGQVRRTPLERSVWLSQYTGAEVFLKLECWQRTRSFKMRGAANAIAGLPAVARARGVVTSSAGNHGQAVALAAAEAGLPATIFVPSDAPRTKKARIRSYGAELNEDAATYDDAERVAVEYARERDAFFVHGFSDPDVVAGQATVGMEILDELPDVREVIVPVGGGGLIGGVGSVMRSAAAPVRIIGVQSERTNAMYEAFRGGHVVDTPVTPTLADGLAGCTNEPAFRLARRVVDELHLVEEAAIAAAVRDHFRHDGIVAEGAAAVGAAALITVPLELRGPVVVVISGGNIDGSRLAALLTAE